ncbi:MAG: YdbH domain-containing protein [Alphaproteobacteria bacterium]
MRHRVGRALWRTVQVFFALLILAGTGLYFGRDELLKQASTELQSLGLPPIDLEISEISLDRIGFSGVSIGDTVKVRDLKAAFAWQEILNGKFERITIENPEITVRQVGDRLDFGDLNPLIFSEDTAPESGDFSVADLQEAMPFHELILKNATVFVVSAQGTTILHFDADITSPGSDIRIEKIRLRADHEDIASFSAEADATLSEDGHLRADLTDLQGNFDLGFAAGQATGGKGNLEGNLLALETLRSSFVLRLKSVKAPFGLRGEAAFDAQTTGTSGEFAIHVSEQATGASSLLRVSATDDGGDHAIAAALQFQAPDLTAASAPFLPDLPLTGQLTLEISTSTMLSHLTAAGLKPTPWEKALAAAPIDIGIKGTSLGMDGLPLAVDTSLAVRVETDGNRKAMRFVEPLTVMAEAGHTDQPIYRTVLPYLDNRYGGPLQVDFGKAGEIGLWVLQKPDGQVSIETGLTTAFRGGGIAPVRMDLNAIGAITPGSPEAALFDVWEFRAIIDDWRSSAGEIGNTVLSVSATGSADDFDGTAILKADVTADWPDTDLAFDVRTGTRLSFRRQNGGIQFGIADCGDIDVHSLSVAGYVLLSKDKTFCLQTPKPVTLRQATPSSAYAPVSGTLRLVLPSNLLRLRLPDRQRIALGGKGSAIDLTMTPPGSGETAPTADLALKLAYLYMTAPKLAAGDIAFSYKGDTGAQQATVGLTVGRLESLEKPALFAPATLESSAEVNGDTIDHKGALRLVSGDARVEYEISHDRDLASGTGLIRPIPLQFGPETVSIDDVSPFLGTLFKALSGTLLGAANIRWDDEAFCIDGDTILQRFGLSPYLAPGGDAIIADGGQLAGRAAICQHKDGTQTSNGELLVENLNIRYGALELLRMNTLLKLPEVIPTLRTDPVQPFSIAVANIGVPLTSGAGVLTINAPDSLDIDDFGFDWAGGRISSGPIAVRDGTVAGGLRFDLSDIDLTRLVELLQLGDDIEAEGTVGGGLTVAFENGQPGRIDGSLASQGKGVLRYRGGDFGTDAASSLLTQALSNFRYDRIEVSVAGTATDEAKITLHLVGKNPDLHDGHPLDLEVSVNGRLASLFKDSLGAYQVPSQIKERMLGYGQ